MSESETPVRDAAIRLTMMPRDTNAHGTVFGGVILSYIDVAGGVEAVRHTKHDRFVTVAMQEIRFHEPVFIGDLVSFYATTTKVGRTSIAIHEPTRAWPPSRTRASIVGASLSAAATGAASASPMRTRTGIGSRRATMLLLCDGRRTLTPLGVVGR